MDVEKNVDKNNKEYREENVEQRVGMTELIGRRILKLLNSIIQYVVLTIILVVVAFASYAMWDSEQIYSAADASQYEKFKPSEEDEGKSFEELQVINPEIFSWLTVFGTNIDYPVAQGETNMKYVNTNAEGNYSLSGSIFLDCNSSKEFSDFNSIIYGHHMEKQTMFGELGLFAEQSYFAARLYGNLYYSGKNHGLEFFAFLHTDAYDNAVFAAKISGKDAQQAYLDGLLEKASYTRNIGVTIEDRIVLLSTCSATSTNGRDILVARITDETYRDSFASIDENPVEESQKADNQNGIWDRLPLWLWIILAAFLLFLIFLVVVYHKR